MSDRYISRLDSYTGRTVALMMLLAAAGLVSLFAMFTFLDQLEDMNDGYTMPEIVRYIAYSLPRMLYETLPYAALIGCLTGLGLLATHSELIVMRTAGVSTWRIALAALRPALALAVIGLIAGELVLPDTERTASFIRGSAKEQNITPGGGLWYREGGSYIHFAAISNRGEPGDISQYHLDGERRLIRTLRAEKAGFVDDEEPGRWIMENVVISHLEPEKKVERLERMSWPTELTPELLDTRVLLEPDRMSMLELRRKIRYLESQGLNTDRFELGFWIKLFQPIALLSLVFVAISFIFGPLREATMGMRVVSGLMLGILFRFIQGLLSPASLVFGFSPLLATVLPIALCLATGYVLLWRAN